MREELQRRVMLLNQTGLRSDSGESAGPRRRRVKSSGKSKEPRRRVKGSGGSAEPRWKKRRTVERVKSEDEEE